MTSRPEASGGGTPDPEALAGVRRWLDEGLADLAAEHHVPGLQVAVLAGDDPRESDDVLDAATGVLSTATGVEVTTDAVFQIGSITKLWTSTLVMQLVGEGLVELEAPVRAYLPEFRVADEDASARITVAQLLTHTAGFEGDVFVGTTRGDDAVQRFVEDVLPDVPQNAAPGELFSYNNAGFVVLGRIVEVLRGGSFGEVLRERLVEPLGLTHVASGAEEAILYRAAVGHLRAGDGAPIEPAKVWAITHSNAPAGSMLAMRARDLVGFARMHQAYGLGPDGTRLLGEAEVRAVREPRLAVPGPEPVTRWGLGWMLFEWPRVDGGTARVIGHDGGTIGQAAALRIVPEAGVAVAVLGNGGELGPVFEETMRRTLGPLAGVEPPPAVVAPAEPVPVGDPRRYAGTYAVQRIRYDVEPDGDGLAVTMTQLDELSAAVGVQPIRRRFVRYAPPDDTREAPAGADRDTFVSAEPIEGSTMVGTFVGDDGDGRARFLFAGRAVPRVA